MVKKTWPYKSDKSIKRIHIRKFALITNNLMAGLIVFLQLVIVVRKGR